MRQSVAVFAVLAVSCGSPAAPRTSKMLVRADVGALDADGVSSTVVHVTGVSKPPLVVTTSRGVLSTTDGQQGTLVKLASDGDVVLATGCSAVDKGACGGYAYVQASDAALTSGTVVIEFACPAGATCKIPAIAYLPPDSRLVLGTGELTGSTTGGGSTGGVHCPSADLFHANCGASASGSHLAGPASSCFVGGTSGSEPEFVDFGYVTGTATLSDPQHDWTFADTVDLQVGTYAARSTSSLPSMKIDLSFLYGSFTISKLQRNTAGQVTEFTAHLEGHCRTALDDEPICGCIHWKP